NISVFNMEGTFEKVLKFHTDNINALFFNFANPNILFSASRDGTITVLDVSMPKGEKCIKVLTGHKGPVTSLSLHPKNPDVFISGSSDRTVRMWDISQDKGKECTKILKVHSSGVNTVDFNKINPDIIASADCGKDIKICDLSKPDNQVLVKTLTGHTDWVGILAFSPDDADTLVSASYNFIIKVWNIADAKGNECKKTLTDHNANIYFVEFCPHNPTIIASSSLDRTIKFWNIKGQDSQECIYSLDVADKVISLAFNVFDPNSIIAISLVSEDQIKIWDIYNQNVKKFIKIENYLDYVGCYWSNIVAFQTVWLPYKEKLAEKPDFYDSEQSKAWKKSKLIICKKNILIAEILNKKKKRSFTDMLLFAKAIKSKIMFRSLINAEGVMGDLADRKELPLEVAAQIIDFAGILSFAWKKLYEPTEKIKKKIKSKKKIGDICKIN
ncbi:WD40 repeat domain-containing protein, partial [Candidatus Dependentiae bacterium]